MLFGDVCILLGRPVGRSWPSVHTVCAQLCTQVCTVAHIQYACVFVCILGPLPPRPHFGSPIAPHIRNCSKKMSPFHNAAATNLSSCVRYLVEQGIDAGHQTSDGKNCIQLARDCGNDDLADWLIDNGRDYHNCSIMESHVRVQKAAKLDDGKGGKSRRGQQGKGFQPIWQHWSDGKYSKEKLRSKGGGKAYDSQCEYSYDTQYEPRQTVRYTAFPTAPWNEMW